jgi:multimeric flavodoxin WrbA
MGNLLILNGSPHKSGNVAALAEQARTAAESKGWNTESEYLNGMNIRPCQACNRCRTTGKCGIDDDMQVLYPKLLGADSILLASPVYFHMYSAQLKTCVDRWYAFFSSSHEALSGKKVGVILTYGNTDLYNSGGINAVHAIESMCRFLGMTVVGCVHGTAAAPGDASQRPGLMRQAASLGRRLAT